MFTYNKLTVGRNTKVLRYSLQILKQFSRIIFRVQKQLEERHFVPRVELPAVQRTFRLTTSYNLIQSQLINFC